MADRYAPRGGRPYWQRYDPSESGLIPEGPGPWRRFRDYLGSEAREIPGEVREQLGRRPPPRRAVRNLANRRALPGGIPYRPAALQPTPDKLTPTAVWGAAPGEAPMRFRDIKAADNYEHYKHAKVTAASAAAGGSTAAQGDNTPPLGTGGTPSPEPPPAEQSGAMPGETREQIDSGYQSRMHAIRMPDGRIVFTNVPQDYVPETGPSAAGQPARMRYEEAIDELGGRVSTPMQTGGGGTAFIQPTDLPVGDEGTLPRDITPLEVRPPMTEREIIERGSTLAARDTDPTDTRSMLERRAWTERRLAEERTKAAEEAEIAKAELAADPRFALAMAEQEGRARWGGEQIEQLAESEKQKRAEKLVAIYEPLILEAQQAGDMELARRYAEILRLYLVALGRSPKEPRMPGIGDALASAISGEVDNTLEDREKGK